VVDFHAWLHDPRDCRDHPARAERTIERCIEPQLAICSADFANQYDHPTQDIRDLLFEQDIRLMTTKTGDIIVKSMGDHTGQFRAINLRAGSTEISSQYDFTSKKAKLLSYNADTIRQLYSTRPSYRNL
jgi:competence protein ComEC